MLEGNILNETEVASTLSYLSSRGQDKLPDGNLTSSFWMRGYVPVW